MNGEIVRIDLIFDSFTAFFSPEELISAVAAAIRIAREQSAGSTPTTVTFMWHHTIAITVDHMSALGLTVGLVNAAKVGRSEKHVGKKSWELSL
jgi:hypothetical protein